MKKTKKTIHAIAVLTGVIAFFALSGAVPDNPGGTASGLLQALICTGIIGLCIVVGYFTADRNTQTSERAANISDNEPHIIDEPYLDILNEKRKILENDCS